VSDVQIVDRLADGEAGGASDRSRISAHLTSGDVVARRDLGRTKPPSSVVQRPGRIADADDGQEREVATEFSEHFHVFISPVMDVRQGICCLPV